MRWRRLGVRLLLQQHAQAGADRRRRDVSARCGPHPWPTSTRPMRPPRRSTLATGLLRLNAPLAYGVRRIAPLMPEFSRRHPAVTVELGLTDAVVSACGRALGHGGARRHAARHAAGAPPGRLRAGAVRRPGLPGRARRAAQRGRFGAAQLPGLHAVVRQRPRYGPLGRAAA